ncbi:MAG: acetylxylan esterase [Planctomycetes bacterium]|nr:acetylxylan esterase [Planctomycetota bacterium]
MVHDYYVDQLREFERRNLARLAALQTKADAEAYVADVRAKIARCFGPQPERTPLNPRITGTLDRDTYRVEKVVFESRPQFFVTANLYLPKNLKGPAPAVVGACGHSANGKVFEAYQSFSQGLVRQGYVALIFDPMGQGERLQLPDENLKPRVNAGTGEHLMVGNQQFLVGEFFGAWRAWDGVRALDYLLTREEVDPRHVGVTGSSGGGTETAWLCGVDQRWTMAAPSSFITTFRRNLENELPGDTEQLPPRVLAEGLDHADFMAAIAPKPIVILAQEQDFFDVRGSIEAVTRLKRLYSLLGASPDDVSLYIGPGGHGYSADAREAMYKCFNRACGREATAPESTLKIETDADLYCTPRGQIADLKNKPITAFTREKAEQLARARSTVARSKLRGAVTDVLKLDARQGVPEFRILRPRRGVDHLLPWSAMYTIETEPGIEAIVYRLMDKPSYSRPPVQANRAILYIAGESSDAELRGEPLIRELVKADSDATLYTCDVRGLGESRPNTVNDTAYASAYGSDYMYAGYAQMFDRPYLGRRTHDVLCVLDWLRTFGHVDVHLVGRGYGALPAAFAALLHGNVTQVTLKNAPASYQQIASVDLYKWPLSAFLPNVLAHFDLPDVYRELQAKKLQLLEPWNVDCRPA